MLNYWICQCLSWIIIFFSLWLLDFYFHSQLQAITKRHVIPSIRKSLWLKIVTHVINIRKSPKSALSLLPETDKDISIQVKIFTTLRIQSWLFSHAYNIWYIQDILPLLPDFDVIDTCKKDVAEALQNCSVDIDSLKQEMQDLTEASLSITKVKIYLPHTLYMFSLF